MNMNNIVDLSEVLDENILSGRIDFNAETFYEIKSLNKEISNLRKELFSYNKNQKEYSGRMEFASYIMLFAVFMQTLFVFEKVREYVVGNWTILFPIIILFVIIIYKKIFAR